MKTKVALPDVNSVNLKRSILPVILLCLFINIKAQDYTFSVRTAAYQNLSSAITVTSGEWDNVTVNGLQLPLGFKYFGDTVTSFNIGDNGISFTSFSDVVIPFEADYKKRKDTASAISYKVEGVASDRILKVEYKMAGFYEENETYPLDFVNFQIWLYEKSYLVEFHYGSSEIDPANLDSLNRYCYLTDITGTKDLALSGNPAAPTVEKDILTSVENLHAFPASGTVYVFTPAYSIGIKEISAGYINIWPNPFQNRLQIESEYPVEEIRVTDMSGKLVYLGSESEINTANWQNGIYLLAIQTNNGYDIKKLIK